MQGLVYIFIALATLGVAAAAYFGLTFSPIEAFVTAIAFGAIAVMLMERRLRQRSEARLERAIEDLARLLSTDAKAGQVLSQRVNAIADTNVGSRLEGIEADISVLGTVTRQLAEALAELEEGHHTERTSSGPGIVELPPEEDDDVFDEPLIPEAELRAALEQNRLVFHIEPVVSLPSRKPLGYDLVPRLMQDAGGLADAPDFMPRRGGEDLVRQIEALALEEAVTIARRAKTSGQPIRLFIPLSKATIGDRKALDQVLATLVANQAITSSLDFSLAQAQYKTLGAPEKRLLGEFGKAGAGFVLRDAASLRFDFAELEGLGFTVVRFDATQFLNKPETFSDFHTADISPYAKRFDIALCATGVIDEQQLLSLFEDGIGLVQGPHIGRPGPVRADLIGERARQPERRQA
ncbi:EAL domain-containing protein [Devosia sp. ZB163]|uniref:EAL domain-containing protein n=1 Tax=Devosia sp. ZB163 TaxID=3025938 RepID=UPI0023610572|nr:EAL domain-containing protein [Devosia sp. ZB163]MDC9823600.1 EAL domain-containing protein [Devosia sp. ZB163]